MIGEKAVKSFATKLANSMRAVAENIEHSATRFDAHEEQFKENRAIGRTLRTIAAILDMLVTTE